MILTALGAVTEDEDGLCQYSDSAGFAAAMDTCEMIAAAEGDWTVQQWRDLAAHLAVLVAAALAARMGPAEAIEYMQEQVGLTLDPAAFRAVLES